jgi:hypothetical protein
VDQKNASRASLALQVASVALLALIMVQLGQAPRPVDNSVDLQNLRTEVQGLHRDLQAANANLHALCVQAVPTAGGGRYYVSTLDACP